MAYDSKVGRSAKVTIGQGTDDQILGIGTWEISGSTVDELDDSEFGDDWEQYLLGIIRGGSVSFSGLYKVDDVSGQDMLRQAFYLKSDITSLKFFVDDSSYYTPNLLSTGAQGGLPANAPTSCINITTEPTITFDKAGLGQIKFTGRVKGVMKFV